LEGTLDDNNYGELSDYYIYVEFLEGNEPLEGDIGDQL